MKYDQSNGGAAALEFARQLTGKPYIYGGTWPQSGGTDCDGLANWAYAQVGCVVNRPTELGYLDSPFDQRNGHQDDLSEPGDLLWIPGSDPGPNGEPGHVMFFVEPGQVFMAEETGISIGQFPYDTSVWSFRTRPALQLPAVVIAPESPASKVAAIYRPEGTPPELHFGALKPHGWIAYLRRLLEAADVARFAHPGLGGYGILTADAVIRFKRQWNERPDVQKLVENSVVGAGVWRALGVE